MYLFDFIPYLKAHFNFYFAVFVFMAHYRFGLCI